MNTTKNLNALLSPTKQKLLGALLHRPERWWYLHELAKTLNVQPCSLQRDLKNLTGAGILERREGGYRTYYRPAPNCPFIPELRRLFRKAASWSKGDE